MNWLYPTAFYGFIALALPIAIHLWSKNRTRQISFGSIRFLIASSTNRSNRLYLSELPLLILRLLILSLVILLMSKWIFREEQQSKNAVLVGKGVEVPEAFKNKEILVLNASDYEKNAQHNKWFLLGEISAQYNNLDTVYYLGNFDDLDFVGAIPEFDFHIELLDKNEGGQVVDSSVFKIDTLNVHLINLSPELEEIFLKLLKTNEIYVNDSVQFTTDKNRKADLIISTTSTKNDIDQIVVREDVIGNHQLHRNSNYSTLFISEVFITDIMRREDFILTISNYLSQLVQPEYQYSGFDQLYTRKSAKSGFDLGNKDYDAWILLLIALLLVIERFHSYRKTL